jgi:hypothetical protein
MLLPDRPQRADRAQDATIKAHRPKRGTPLRPGPVILDPVPIGSAVPFLDGD